MDNRHVFNLTAGKKFEADWEVGLKFRYLGGTPYTPYDTEQSALKEVWDVNQQGVYDWNQINQLRSPDSHGIDVRIDKKWFFEKCAVNIYLDIQNIYNFKIEQQSYIDVVRDTSGNPITDPNNSLNYKITEIENRNGTILPSIGVMVDF